MVPTNFIPLFFKSLEILSESSVFDFISEIFLILLLILILNEIREHLKSIQLKINYNEVLIKQNFGYIITVVKSSTTDISNRLDRLCDETHNLKYQIRQLEDIVSRVEKDININTTDGK